MNLDVPAAILCGVFAAALFHIHAISSPKRDKWLNLPAYVRTGLLLSGIMMTWRSVNFLSIAGDGLIAQGHINAEGMMALICLTYTFGALAVWLSLKQLQNQGWSRLTWVERLLRRNPNNAPVVMTLDEVAQTHRALGAEVATGPGEHPPGTLH